MFLYLVSMHFLQTSVLLLKTAAKYFILNSSAWNGNVVLKVFWGIIITKKNMQI